MADTPIRILLVDDSAMARTILSRIFEKSPDVDVVGTAMQGQQALEMVEKLEPAVVCTDLHMPVMNGLELTKQIMAKFPRPILVISNAVQEGDKDNVFELLQAGALDVFPKPKGGSAGEYESVANDLIRKIRVLAGVRVIRKRHRKLLGGSSAGATKMRATSTRKTTAKATIVAIGASTGGPQAYHAVLSELPADFPVPVVCIQHIGEGFLQSMVSWLNSKCSLCVKIAESGEKPARGTVYFAPDSLHLEVNGKGTLVSSNDEPLDGHRPSITRALQSVAAHFRERAVGVLLTGMGRDGADGLQAIAQAGGVTIAQDEETCVVFGMPQRAIELGAAKYVLPLNKIAAKLKQTCG